MKQFREVLQFEYSNFIKSKPFVIVTVILALLIYGGLTVIPMLGNMSESDGVISQDKGEVVILDPSGFISSTAPFESALPEYIIRTEKTVDMEDIKTKINNGEITGLFDITEIAKPVFYEKRQITGYVYAMMGGVYQTVYQSNLLSELGVGAQDIQNVVTPPEFSFSETEKGMMDTYIYTYVLVMLLYMTIMIYGQLVATGVASEKSSRAMELLITTADYRSLLFGKLVGVGLVGFTQISIFIGVAFGALSANRDYWSEIDVIGAIYNMPMSILVYMLVFYILGYFCYAALFGAMGSICSRVEDVSTACIPLTLVVVAVLMLAMNGMVTPDAAHIKILSLVPFFSQMIMFVRICTSTVSPAEITASIVLLAAATYGTALLAAKIYRAGTLLYGKTPSPIGLIKILRADKAVKKG